MYWMYCLPHSQSFPPGGFCTCKVLLVVLISALGIVFKLQKSVLKFEYTKTSIFNFQKTHYIISLSKESIEA